jgi:hypothetical protein
MTLSSRLLMVILWAPRLITANYRSGTILTGAVVADQAFDIFRILLEAVVNAFLALIAQMLDRRRPNLVGCADHFNECGLVFLGKLLAPRKSAHSRIDLDVIKPQAVGRLGEPRNLSLAHVQFPGTKGN